MFELQILILFIDITLRANFNFRHLFYNFSLQQINQILHEKIESQAKQQHQLKSQNNNYMVDRQSCGTQTVASTDKSSVYPSASVSTQTEHKSPTASPAPRAAAPAKKPTKQNIPTKDDTHLLATIRGMRVDLAIKEKALQRLTRELDECKKTIKKLQKENESMSECQLPSLFTSIHCGT